MRGPAECSVQSNFNQTRGQVDQAVAIAVATAITEFLANTREYSGFNCRCSAGKTKLSQIRTGRGRERSQTTLENLLQLQLHRSERTTTKTTKTITTATAIELTKENGDKTKKQANKDTQHNKKNRAKCGEVERRKTRRSKAQTQNKSVAVAA